MVLLLGLQRTFSRLGVGFGGIGLVVRLVTRRSRSTGFTGNFSSTFPVSCVYGLNKFTEACEGVQLVMVDHVVFDMFGQSIVSLLMECFFTPLDLCG